MQEHVTTQQKNDCAICAVANTMNIRYKVAEQILGNCYNEQFGVTWNELHFRLQGIGFISMYTDAVNNIEALEASSAHKQGHYIVVLLGHCLAYNNGKFYDSEKFELKQTDKIVALYKYPF